MAYKIVTTKIFLTQVEKVNTYLEVAWNLKIAIAFQKNCLIQF